ncbi:hypothetical protein CYLTODRAFT_202121 [Cylindrobasidium torrendii FP15055 ss-10]|uniref:Zn(2)-C6 fungal-type domain-containing protein n=1 Tax=Cylindrobasidium torrendii FP15055 ss-10 TaxID=1314674 RepID=A0A0D7BJ18_9AGAR|nr:hypothetical protein CYLTODRAFT_202121 [Cylindrobasidium torrendii FP15055 ss-10]
MPIDSDYSRGVSKKRRLQGACDLCRRKKVKCDSATMLDNKCTNCIAQNAECTHVAARRKKSAGDGSPCSSTTPLASIEDIRAHMKAILSHTDPYVLPKDVYIVKAILVDLARYASQLESEVASLKAYAAQFSVPPSPDCSSSSSSSSFDGDAPVFSAQSLQQATGSQEGPYSGTSLALDLLDLKGAILPATSASTYTMRAQHWNIHPWQRPIREPDPPVLFPPTDLLNVLVSRFFNLTNIHLCLLHAPTFRRQIAAEMHYSCPAFGRVVLAVCAVASRGFDDPRVGSGIDAGWQWYNQIRVPRPSDMLEKPTLFDVQLYPLLCTFLDGTSSRGLVRYLSAVGTRMAQDLGLHRKPDKAVEEWTTEDELRKRAFWAQVLVDIYDSALDGTPRGMCTEDYDVDYPLEVDDEYWPGEPLADVKRDWTQPKTIPSRVTAYVEHLKLLEILGFAGRTIYSLKRSELWDAISPEWGRNIAVHLDSALNNWVDSIPAHLKWDPCKTNSTFFAQSAQLISAYYFVQLAIHRPLLPRVNSLDKRFGEDDDLASLPSSLICVNAARSCTHVLEAFAKRSAITFTPMITTVYHSALLMIMNMWTSERHGLKSDPQKQTQDIRTCMSVLQRQESCHQTAGRYLDVLRGLYGDDSGAETEPSTSSTNSIFQTPGGCFDTPEQHFQISEVEMEVDAGPSVESSPAIQTPVTPWGLPPYTADLMQAWPSSPDLLALAQTSPLLNTWFGNLQHEAQAQYDSPIQSWGESLADIDHFTSTNMNYMTSSFARKS